ncbi:hypothetical protein CH330_02950 [candidate division WOR-3 bacterium JGI_Cruoil_03_51_56]|uniref:LiaF transmembrane domain-containing protein n=1 Tax=candidate division WOR-3 bacterium JGI_Cruoil_03_51_56 TaxID=1973747 RepID=A0A235BW90_UNCW3|nr:MAG: hypothetical protein CH330_02950 [candidate division WOR-3 bacterium JGI_Cruoil_03_51_56]
MKRIWCGIVIMVVGLWIWLSCLGVPYISFSKNWPLLLIALGIYIIARRVRKAVRTHRSAGVIINDLEDGKINAEDAISEIKRGKNDR